MEAIALNSTLPGLTEIRRLPPNLGAFALARRSNEPPSVEAQEETAGSVMQAKDAWSLLLLQLLLLLVAGGSVHAAPVPQPEPLPSTLAQVRCGGVNKHTGKAYGPELIPLFRWHYC